MILAKSYQNYKHIKKLTSLEILTIRWEKVLILIINKGGNIYTKNKLLNFPKLTVTPSTKQKPKVLGRIMDSTNNVNNAINDRLQKPNAAQEILKRKLLGGLKISTKLRLMLFGPLIFSILLYSLHIIPICKK